VKKYFPLIEESMFVNTDLLEDLKLSGLIEISDSFLMDISDCKTKGFRADKKVLEKYFEEPFSTLFLNNDLGSMSEPLKQALEKLKNKENVVATPQSAALLIEYAFKNKITIEVDSKINLSNIVQVYVDLKYKDQAPYIIIILLKMFLNNAEEYLSIEQKEEINSFIDKLELLEQTNLNEVESVFQEVFNSKENIQEISKIIQIFYNQIQNKNEIPLTNIYLKIIETLHGFSKTIGKKNQYFVIDNHLVISPSEIKEIEIKRFDSVLKHVIPQYKRNVNTAETSTKPVGVVSNTPNPNSLIVPENFALNQDKLQIALLIDCDNAPAKAVEGVINELSKYGVVNIRKAYGDWKSPLLKGWEAKLHEFVIIPVQQFAYTKGKNATDIAMAIDTMEILYTREVKAFAFMTSDSDFTPLIMKLLSNGMTVFGFGEQKTPSPFVQACSRFIYTENLVKEEVLNTNSTYKKDLNKEVTLLKLLDTAIEQTSNENGWSNVAALGLYLNNNSSFSPLNYGYQKLGQMLKAIDKYEVYMDNLTMYVHIKEDFF
jgi:uncharacterized protein (TIGR00288 family)